MQDARIRALARANSVAWKRRRQFFIQLPPLLRRLLRIAIGSCRLTSPCDPDARASSDRSAEVFSRGKPAFRFSRDRPEAKHEPCPEREPSTAFVISHRICFHAPVRRSRTSPTLSTFYDPVRSEGCLAEASLQSVRRNPRNEIAGRIGRGHLQTEDHLALRSPRRQQSANPSLSLALGAE